MKRKGSLASLNRGLGIARGLAIAIALFISTAGGLFAQETKNTLSVLYFGNTSGAAEWAWLSKGLADMLVSDLGATGAFVLVEREELEKALREQELALSGMVDEKSAPQVGLLLGAKTLIYGSFIVRGAELRLDAKAVDAGSGAVLHAASAAGKAADALALQRELAEKLAIALGAKPARGAAATDSVGAARAYYRGLDSMDAGRYAEAADFFASSAREDPLFLKPGKGLEEAYRYLKDFRRQRYRREMNNLAADIADLTKRITAPRFYSFADAVMDPTRFGWKDAAEATAFYRARPAVMNGATPVEAIWHLQNLLGELADKAEDYFEDQALAARCRDEILVWADAAEAAHPLDPFLPETIYQRLFVLRERKDWEGVRTVCERLMGDYPDYRMMWAVEDMYADALEKLGA